ncbi:MAG: hypothetical protein AB7S26_33645 [Sandaracinaceae bacterium]
MTNESPEDMQRFADAMRDAIVSLPQDMKAMLRIVEDPDLGDADRVLAAGALIHVLSAHNAIPGVRGLLAYVDDAIILRLVLERIEASEPELIAAHRADSPELFAPLAAQMDAVRAYLGERLAVLDKACDGLAEMSHQGHGAVECASTEEGTTWLYDAVHEALIRELEFDEDDVTRALKEVDKIIRPLDQRLK